MSFPRAPLSLTVLAWTLLAPWVMRRGPRDAFESWRRPRPVATSRSPENLVTIADKILLARVFGKLLFRTRCLKRTLVLWRLLRAHGHDVRAVVGFDREGAHGLAGHAWLELEGARIPDPIFSPVRAFTPFLVFGDRTEVLTESGPR